MSEYVDFHYMPLEGKITGEQVLKQTEDAINDLGNKVYSLDIDQSEIDEAIEKSNEAINTANSALSAVTTGRSVWFNNVAEMVATDIEAGVTAETKGYYVANDGGNALYLVRQEKSGDVVDGGSLIALDNGNMAELVTDGTVNVKQFGAKGDGVTDDSSALLSALAFSDNIYIPKGTYVVDDDIAIANDYVTICGAGRNDTHIKGNGTLTINGHHFICKDINFTWFGDIISNTHSNTFQSCRIDHCKGIRFNKGYICQVLNCFIDYNTVGVVLDDECYETVISDSVIDNNNIGVIVMGTSSGLRISKCTIETNRDMDTETGCGVMICNNRMDVVLDKCWFENNGSSANSVDVLVLSTNNKNTFSAIKTMADSLLGETIGLSNNYGRLTVTHGVFNYTQYGVAISGGYGNEVNIIDNCVMGTLNKYNKLIYVESSQHTYFADSKLVAKRNKLVNTNNLNIHTQLLQGVKLSYIYVNIDDLTESDKLSAIQTNAVTYDDKPLFLAEGYFSDFSNVIYCGVYTNDGTVYTAGYMDDAIGTHEMQAVKNGTGSRFVTNASTSSTSVFGTTGDKKFIVVSPPFVKYRYQRNNNGSAQNMTRNNSADGYCMVLSEDLYSAWLLQNDNNMPVIAIILLTDTEYAKCKDCSHIQLHDLHYAISAGN